jgi:hypothetical protein
MLSEYTAELSFFSDVVEWCFCRGFCEIWAVDDGVLMVILWRIGGKRWSFSDHLFLAENFPLFELYFG